MPDRVFIPLPGIGTLALTREQYEAALIPIAAPAVAKPPPPPVPRQSPAPFTHAHETFHGLRYIRLREVCARVGIRPSAVYHLISLGRFPKQVKLSERTSAWIESEVEAFMDARITERDSKLSDTVPAPSPYMRMGEVMKVTGLSSSSIYDLVRKGEFPKWAPLPKIASGWIRNNIDQWMANRPNVSTATKRKMPTTEETS